MADWSRYFSEIQQVIFVLIRMAGVSYHEMGGEKMLMEVQKAQIDVLKSDNSNKKNNEKIGTEWPYDTQLSQNQKVVIQNKWGIEDYNFQQHLSRDFNVIANV